MQTDIGVAHRALDRVLRRRHWHREQPPHEPPSIRIRQIPEIAKEPPTLQRAIRIYRRQFWSSEEQVDGRGPSLECGGSIIEGGCTGADDRDPTTC